MITLGDAALAYVNAGLPVFPVAPRGKRPINANGCRGATLDVAQVRAWWSQSPAANIGVATGPMSKLFVLDVDPGHGGSESLRALSERPPSWTVETPSGGSHHWYRYPVGRHLGNTAGRLGPGLDTRGAGGYVVAPPSVGANGRRYRWLARGDLSDTPPSMISALERNTTTSGSVAPPTIRLGEPTAYGLAALIGETTRVALCLEGTRNSELNRSAFRIGQLEAGGELPLFYSWEPLTDAGFHAGLSREEAAGVAERALRAGHECPRRRAAA